MQPWQQQQQEQPQKYRRAASLLATQGGAALQFAGRRLVLWDGVAPTPSALRVTIPAELTRSWHPALSGRPWPATADFADVSPVGGRDRVRANLRLTGTLRREQSACEAAPWTLQISTCHWQEFDGAAPATIDLEVARLSGVRPDPLAGDEAELIMHLHAAHLGVVERLSRLVPVDRLHGAIRVAVWRMEREGITLRIERANGRFALTFLEWPPADSSDAVCASLAALLARTPTCPRTWAV